jgi:hypothetical protein
MFLKRRMSADQARAHERCPHVFLALALALPVFSACHPQLQNTAVYMGDGVMKGEPPICFQYRSEARPTSNANNIWVHINNTCSYAVDCNVWDSVTDQQHRMMAPEYQSRSFMVAAESPESRVSIKLECTWKS